MPGMRTDFEQVMNRWASTELNRAVQFVSKLGRKEHSPRDDAFLKFQFLSLGFSLPQ